MTRAAADAAAFFMGLGLGRYDGREVSAIEYAA